MRTHTHGGQAEGQAGAPPTGAQSPGEGGQALPGGAELCWPSAGLAPTPRSLHKQQNQGLGGWCSSPEDGEQDSIEMLLQPPSLQGLLPRDADQEEADLPGQASIEQAVFPAS